MLSPGGAKLALKTLAGVIGAGRKADGSWAILVEKEDPNLRAHIDTLLAGHKFIVKSRAELEIIAEQTLSGRMAEQESVADHKFKLIRSVFQGHEKYAAKAARDIIRTLKNRSETDWDGVVSIVRDGKSVQDIVRKFQVKKEMRTYCALLVTLTMEEHFAGKKFTPDWLANQGEEV